MSMCHAVLQAIFQSVAIAKLLYASVPGLDSPMRLTSSESMDSYDAASAVATVRQTLLHLPNSVQLRMNNYLITFVITRITYCSLLPPPSTASQNYYLRPQAHSQQLPQHTGHLTDSNFITRNSLACSLLISTKPSYNSTDDDVKKTVHNNLINYYELLHI